MSRKLIIPGAVLLAVAALASFGILATAAVFTETFSGAPAQPISFDSANWEVAYHGEWGTPNDAPRATSTLAQHGPNCEAPAEDGSVTHATLRITELVYQCRDHIMTHVPDDGYQVIYLTPNQLADLSNGPATIRFDVSTLSRSARDWVGVWIQGWDTQEQRILEADIPTMQANPRNAVHVEMGASCCSMRSDGTYHVQVYDSNRQEVAGIAATGPSWTTKIVPSAQTRQTVEIVLSRTHIKVWAPTLGIVWVDQDIPALQFTQGVVSLGHHSYSAWKGEDMLTGACCGSGKPNTWHWDNVSISPSTPFSIVHSDKRAAMWNESVQARTFTFDAPAPANSYLRFSAFGESVRLAFDGGAMQPATRSGEHNFLEHATSYLMRVPQGATRVTFEMTPTWGLVGQVTNPTIFSRSGSAPTVSATASPSSTATATATKTATATATATSTGSATATPTKTATPAASATPPAPAPSNSNAECQAQFRYRDKAGSGVFREVWRTVDCRTGAAIEVVR